MSGGTATHRRPLRERLDELAVVTATEVLSHYDAGKTP